MRSLLLVAFLFPLAASAAELDCAIKARDATKKTGMPGLAKISVGDATKIAIGAVNVPGASIMRGGLEVDDGCLVFSFDIDVPDQRGFDEVVIDAGNGKVLTAEHEDDVEDLLEKLVYRIKKWWAGVV